MTNTLPVRGRRRAAARPLQLRDLPLDGRGALHDQIYRAFCAAILSGRVARGIRLPPSRGLAAELGVSRKAVVLAFEALRAEGYVEGRVGDGTYVAAQVAAQAPLRARAPNERVDGGESSKPPRLSRHGRALVRTSPRRLYDADAARAPLRFDFRPCVPELEGLDYEPWRRALARTSGSLPIAELDYSDPAGALPLRQEIALYLARARGVVCRAEEIVIVGGLAQALDLATRLLVDAGDAVLIEDPHYLGARRVFEAAGARLVGVPVDREGLDLAGARARDLERCRLAYVTPSHQFPTGAVLSLARRQALLAWAARRRAFVIEDDYDSEFRYAGRAIPALKSLDDRGRVLYVGTFSKTLLPGLRIAYVVLPPELHSVFRTAKWLADGASPRFEQFALARFLESGDFERHLRRARTRYAASRAALIDALERERARLRPEWIDSRAGLHLLVRFPTIPGDQPFEWILRGRARELGLYPAAPCRLGPPPAGLELVMGFARLGKREIDAGVARLAELLCDGDPAPEAGPGDLLQAPGRSERAKPAGRRRDGE